MLLVTETTDFDNSDYLRNRLAVETISTTDVISLFRQLLPKSADLIKAYLPSLSDLEVREHDTTKKLNNKDFRKAVEKAKGISFVAFSDTLVTVPEGFAGHLLPYLETLLVQNRTLSQFALQTLTEYNTQLAVFLSNADSRQSLKTQRTFLDKTRKTRELYEKAVATFFDKKHTTLSRRKLGETITRFADLDAVFAQAEALEQLRTHRSYREIIENVKKASDLLTLIRGRMDSSDIAKVSGVVAKDLADGAYEVAKLVEVLATYGYHTETALASVHSLANQLSELL